MRRQPMWPRCTPTGLPDVDRRSVATVNDRRSGKRWAVLSIAVFVGSACGSATDTAAAPPSVGDVTVPLGVVADLPDGDVADTFPAAPDSIAGDTSTTTAIASTTTAGTTTTSGTRPEVTDPIPTRSTVGTATASTSPTNTTTNSTGPVEQAWYPDEPVGANADGNRVLVIGDSLIESTSPRYAGPMCDALVPLGWQVEIDAETGRFVDFGEDVISDRLQTADGTEWDAAVVFLGNNADDDIDGYRQSLSRILWRLAPRPTLIYTVTERDERAGRINDVVRSRADVFPNVEVIDWAAVTAAQGDELLAGDGLHLSEAGRLQLAMYTAAGLGEAPQGRGRCLEQSVG